MRNTFFILLFLWVPGVMLAQEILAYYRFNDGEFYKDSSPNGNDLTAVSSLNLKDKGKDGSALSGLYFAGDQYISPENPASMSFSNDGVSLSLWIKPLTDYNNMGTFIGKGRSRTDERFMEFYGHGDSVWFYLSNELGEKDSVALGKAPVKNVWQQLAVIYHDDTKEVDYYYNGVLQKTTVLNFSAPSDFSQRWWVIGGGGFAFDYFLKGAIVDDVRIYKGAIGHLLVEDNYKWEKLTLDEQYLKRDVLAAFNMKNTKNEVFPLQADYLSDKAGTATQHYANMSVLNDARHGYGFNGEETSVDKRYTPYLEFTLDNIDPDVKLDRLVFQGVSSYFGEMRFQLRWAADDFETVLQEIYPSTGGYSLASFDLTQLNMQSQVGVLLRVYFYQDQGSVYFIEGDIHNSIDGTPGSYNLPDYNITFWYTQEVTCEEPEVEQYEEALFVQDGADHYQWIDCDLDDTPITFQNNDTLFSTLVSKNYSVRMISEYCDITSDCHSPLLLTSSESFLSEQDVMVFPNPTSGVVLVKMAEGEIDCMEVIDSKGEKVIQTRKEYLDFSSLDKGIYLVRIKTLTSEYFKKVIRK